MSGLESQIGVGSGIVGLSHLRSTTYHLASNVTGNQDPLVFGYLTDSATSGNAAPATSSTPPLMTESSGIFTFAETGYYFIYFHGHSYNNASSGNMTYHDHTKEGTGNFLLRPDRADLKMSSQLRAASAAH